ncbi:MAG TPA: hypothetical protein VG603_10225 [Chitinophagales bacterium]|nr:hypothetical protein [Chitinophagales bacterium]
MKKVFAGFFALILLASGVSSCKKCYTCTFSAGRTEELCTKDFPNGNKDLKLTIDAYEAQGYVCNAQ